MPWRPRWSRRPSTRSVAISMSLRCWGDFKAKPFASTSTGLGGARGVWSQSALTLTLPAPMMQSHLGLGCWTGQAFRLTISVWCWLERSSSWTLSWLPRVCPFRFQTYVIVELYGIHFFWEKQLLYRSSSTSSSSSTRAAYVAEAQDGDPTLETIDEDNDNDEALDEQAVDDEAEGDEHAEDDDELIPDDPEEINLEQLSQVGSLHPRSLAPTQESQPRSLSESRPHCAACGARGHWKDDDACPMKGKKGSSTSRQSGSNMSNKFAKSIASPKQPSQAFQVVHHEHGRVEVSDEGYGNMFQCNMVIVPQQKINDVFISSTDDLVGFLVLDSACQRTCCGERWYHAHTKQLSKKYQLMPKEISCEDVFQFGKGSPQTAEFRSYLPSCVDGQKPFLLAAAVLQTGIPLLGSSKLLQRLGTILNMPEGLIHLRAIDFTMPLLKHNVHLVVDIMQFPKDAKTIWDVGRSFQHLIFGMTRIVNWLQCEMKLRPLKPWPHRQPWLQPLTLMQALPPAWMCSWRRVVKTLMNFGKDYVKMMVGAVMLGFQLMSWLLRAIPPEMQEHTNKDPSECKHEYCKRYGNKHGRFAKCPECETRFWWNEATKKWDLEGALLPLQKLHHKTCHPRRLQWSGLKHESGTQPSSSCSRQRFGRNGVRLGTGWRLQGTLKNNINNLESEVKIYEALRSVAERPPPRIDILELFSGTSKLTIHASKHHLNALQRMDLNHGQDFHDPQVHKTTILAMKKFKPWLAMIGIRCTKWSQFNINLNYSSTTTRAGSRDALGGLYMWCLWGPVSRWSLLPCREPGSRLWTLQPVKTVLSWPNVWTSTLDTGAFGAEIDGRMIAKPMTHDVHGKCARTWADNQ